jgi:RNAse (barnase) inhibitor barstar
VIRWEVKPQNSTGEFPVCKFDQVYMNKKTLTIDGRLFSDLKGFYNTIDKVLTADLTWQTGHNMHALNDLLRGGFGVHEYEESIKLIWLNSDKSKCDLGFDETIKYLEEKLKTCHPTNIEYVKADLAAAREHKGKTLFDPIIGTIKEHDHIEFERS